MAVATRFHNFQVLGAPPAIATFAAAGNSSPNLRAIHDHLIDRYGGQNLGFRPNPRPVRGGSTPSTHTWGALDWRYEDSPEPAIVGRPGPGRHILLTEIIPFLIDHSAELGIQAIHDYVGSRIWRAWRPVDQGGAGWRPQSPGSQMGQPWAKWIHVEVHPDDWFDGRTVTERTTPAPPPPPPPPPAPAPPEGESMFLELVRLDGPGSQDSPAYAVYSGGYKVWIHGSALKEFRRAQPRTADGELIPIRLVASPDEFRALGPVAFGNAPGTDRFGAPLDG